MDYITHRRFRNLAACGQKMNLPYGTELRTIGKYIATSDGKAICCTTSENAHLYFACNDDGQGLLRGALTYAIAYGKRGSGGFRFSDGEIQLLETKWSQYLRQDVSTILFNQAFFDAPIWALKAIAADLNIHIKEE